MPHPSRPKLGQHFLSDQQYRHRILDALDICQRDLVIEIGAGRGAMTGLLAQRAGHLVAIELDRVHASHLQNRFKGQPSVEILTGDVLTTDIAAICRRFQSEQCFVFGNIPYYITSPILERLREYRVSIRGMALLVQREVADRIVAVPASRDYGYLSVFVQLFSKPRLLFTVPPGAFSPPPKIQSALVEFQLEPRFPGLSEEEQDKFLKFVQSCFAQKRKNIINNLLAFGPRAKMEKILGGLNLPVTIRAEQLTLEQFAALQNRLE